MNWTLEWKNKNISRLPIKILCQTSIKYVHFQCGTSSPQILKSRLVPAHSCTAKRKSKDSCKRLRDCVKINLSKIFTVPIQSWSTSSLLILAMIERVGCLIAVRFVGDSLNWPRLMRSTTLIAHLLNRRRRKRQSPKVTQFH